MTESPDTIEIPRNGARQTEIPGTERHIPDAVRIAAAEYVRVLDQRLALTRDESDAREALIHAMESHQIESAIVTDEAGAPRLVTYEAQAKVRVVRVKDPAGAE